MEKKYLYGIIAGIVVLAIIAGFVMMSYSPSENIQEVSVEEAELASSSLLASAPVSVKCDDSIDNNYNIWKGGILFVNKQKVGTDFCSKSILTEYFCMNNKPQKTSLDCNKYGGNCVQTKCTDSKCTGSLGQCVCDEKLCAKLGTGYTCKDGICAKKCIPSTCEQINPKDCKGDEKCLNAQKCGKLEDGCKGTLECKCPEGYQCNIAINLGWGYCSKITTKEGSIRVTMVNVAANGAKVYVDDVFKGVISTPEGYRYAAYLQIDNVAIGKRRVNLTYPGYKDYINNLVEVFSGKTTPVDVTLKKK